MATSPRLTYLVQELVSRPLLATEREELQLLLVDADPEILSDQVLHLIPDGPVPAYDSTLLSILQNVLKADRQPASVRPITVRRRWQWMAAAGLIAALGTGIYLFNRTASVPTTIAVVQQTPPGSQKATLTLSNGQTIPLDSNGNQVISQAGATVLQKGGQLQYANNDTETSTVYNTLTTPKGGQFQVVLPDGTKVWLNAASSLRYPTVFTGSQRTVYVTGEAYFEVAANKQQPFHVTINDHTDIEVIGTHYNVNAYLDENSINTTLLEGSLKVHVGQQQQLLAPGQQAQVNAQTGTLNLVKNADVQQAIAWRSGLFSFTDADLPAVMRQLARWYNVEVVYQGAIPDRQFNGKIGRNLTLEQVLNGLARSRVNYTIEKGKIIIRP